MQFRSFVLGVAASLVLFGGPVLLTGMHVIAKSTGSMMLPIDMLLLAPVLGLFTRHPWHALAGALLAMPLVGAEAGALHTSHKATPLVFQLIILIAVVTAPQLFVWPKFRKSSPDEVAALSRGRTFHGGACMFGKTPADRQKRLVAAAGIIVMMVLRVFTTHHGATALKIVALEAAVVITLVLILRAYSRGYSVTVMDDALAINEFGRINRIPFADIDHLEYAKHARNGTLLQVRKKGPFHIDQNVRLGVLQDANGLIAELRQRLTPTQFSDTQ